MSYRATPNKTTGFSPYFLLHGSEMALPNSDNFKSKLLKEKENFDQDRRLENLKSILKLAYKAVKKTNRQSHLNNKRLYDRKTKLRSFQLEDIVYQYNPARKPGKCFKFYKFWTGSFKITAKLSDLNYEIISMSHKKQVVHVNRLKNAYDPEIWKPKQEPEAPKKRINKRFPKSEKEEEEDIRIGSVPLLEIQPQETGVQPGTLPSQDPDTPEFAQRRVDMSSSERRDPNYEPPSTPRSRRELRDARPEPPLTRARTGAQTQDLNIAETSAVCYMR
jgi:hypothetical protein